MLQNMSAHNRYVTTPMVATKVHDVMSAHRLETTNVKSGNGEADHLFVTAGAAATARDERAIPPALPNACRVPVGPGEIGTPWRRAAMGQNPALSASWRNPSVRPQRFSLTLLCVALKGPSSLEKTFFSTRRPVLVTGG
jgi:hypothetical protein